ncbi:MAG: diaminopimelate epimerase [Flavobacteriales bacterium]|jgi:diaminopimelate epimerase|nr:diaminopimelate epimerase [Flavobacteriales bacterium]MBT5090201.1 diaminopimelate epimerase [Flavobacteriales bacterium]MBT5615632.1 diaminopimelate epimerase [Flavobacteriales bacterium]MBT5749880.1 diaminopimelate epimerase [Flavobacteriales bacterium]
MIIEFYKYQGTGNDFIIIDDREKEFDITDNNLIAALCERRMGIGADGFILLREHDTLDFEMIYFNADGKQSSMCGNGGRCIIAFAQMLEMIEDETTFMAIDGEHKGRLMDDGIYLQMQDVKEIEGVGDGLLLNTGSPHYIEMVDELEYIDVNKQGKKIRNSIPFKKEGINVNFVLDASELQVRTYERGVEAETLSCGTGVVATAIAMHYANCIEETLVNVKTKGGELTVSFEEFNGGYRNIWLSAEASMVFAGEFAC